MQVGRVDAACLIPINITPAAKYRSILFGQFSICCVIMNRCSTCYRSIFCFA